MLVITLAALIGAGDGVGHWLGASTAVDRRVSTTFADHRTSFLDGFTQRFSQLGSTYVVIGIALTVIVIGLARRRVATACSCSPSASTGSGGLTFRVGG